MAAPLTVTTSTTPGLLQGAFEAATKPASFVSSDEAELASQRKAAEAEAAKQNVVIRDRDMYAPKGTAKFLVTSPGLRGDLEQMNFLAPSRYITVGAQEPPAAPELTAEPTVPPTPSGFDVALEFKPDVQGAYDAASAMLPGAQRISAVGYTPGQVGESADYAEARRMSEDAKNDVLQKRDAYMAQSLEARNKQTGRLEQDVVDEQGRMGRLKTAGEDLTTLNKTTKEKQEAFQVDPNRLFGQGAQRAATTFALGLQNIMSNVGEAMQGKAGTNAVLALVRDRIAQDVDMQEKDYGRMMQGFQVQRNGLMDAIQQVGNERAGAEALAKQQGLAYADQLTKLAESTGYAKSKEAYPLIAAATEIRMKLAQAEQQRQEFNQGEKSAAGRFAAQSAQAAQTANVQLEAARQTAISQQASLRTQITPYDMAKADKVTEEARKAKLGEQYTLLNRIGALASDPAAAKELGGLVSSFQASVGRDANSGAISQWAAAEATKTLSPVQQQLLELIKQYRGLRETGMGGKAISGIEDFLFNPFDNATPGNISRKVDNARLQLVDARDDLYKQANFNPQSPAGAYLANGLAAFVPDRTSQVAQPPNLQIQTTKGTK